MDRLRIDDPVPGPETQVTQDAVDGEREGVKLIRSLGNGLVASLSGVLVCVGIIIAVVFLMAGKLDGYAGVKSLEKTQRLLSVEIQRLADLSLEYGWWNEAVEMVIYERDLPWAEEYVGQYLQERYGLEAVLSLDTSGNLVYGRYQDQSLQGTIPDPVWSETIQDLINTAMITDLDDPKPAVGYVRVGQTPAIAAVTAYVVYEPTELALDRVHGAFVMVKLIDQALLSAWSSNFHIDDLRFEASDGGNDSALSNSLALTMTNDEVLGHLIWSPEMPGREFLALVLPWAVGAGLAMALACLFFFFKLRRYGRLARLHFIEMITNRKVLQRQAQFDFLTGLVNRPLFLELVSREMNRCFRHHERAAVVYIDLDGFKMVNDSLGHDMGDDLLCMVAAELKNSVRREDTVARFGGDEFCLLLTNLSDASDVERVLEKIHQRFAQPLQLGSQRVLVGASAGVVVIPDDTQDCSSVFRYADMAMYAAKAQGANGFRFYSDDMEIQSRQRSALKSHLSTALTNDELYLVYQPVYSLADRKVHGLEALLRWQNPELGGISPAEFIPIAEETGAIEAIGLWVVEQALRDMVALDGALGRELTISINVSVKQLRDEQLPRKLTELVERFGCNPARVKLEITESLLIGDHENEDRVLQALSDRGFKLVLDDFGTGYSALGYLQKYPLETIKIDKSFVSEGDALINNSSLVNSIVYLARTMGMKTVAEGIETEEQERFLLGMGCVYGQGFYFSRPERPERIIEFVMGIDNSKTLP